MVYEYLEHIVNGLNLMYENEVRSTLLSDLFDGTSDVEPKGIVL